MKLLRLFLFFLLFLLPVVPLCFSEGSDDFSALIDKGETLIQQGSYPAGISILEAVLTKDPRNIKALNSLLSACDTYSQKLLAQNHFDQAETYLKKMEETIQRIDALPTKEFSNTDLKTQSRVKREIASAKTFLLSPKQAESTDIVSLNSGRELYNEAVLNFNKRQYEVAETLLKESVELDATNPYAFELLGEIANLKHKLDEADSYYRKAFSLNPDPKLREKYEKLIREKDIDKMQQEYSDEHFIVRYRRSENLEGSKIRDFLRDAYRDISQDFGYYPKYKIPVLLYDWKEYQSLMGSVPHWSGALYDGKIRLPVYQNAMTEQSLKKLIYHELTHAFVLDLTQMKCPIWLNEGLAQYEENKIEPINLQVLIGAVRAKTLISMDELMFEDISKNPSQEKAIIFYLESFSFVFYVIEHSRLYNMKQLLISIGKETPFLEAFEKEFGRSFKEFASDWRENLEHRYGS